MSNRDGVTPRICRRWLLAAALCLAAATPSGAAAAPATEESPAIESAEGGRRSPERVARGESAARGAVCPICHHANNQQALYPQRAGGALMRGAINTTFGWTELLTRPAEEVKTGGNLIVGVGSGLGRATKRTFMGIGELFTFWVPKGQQGYLNLNTDCPICMGIRTPPSPSPKPAKSN